MEKELIQNNNPTMPKGQEAPQPTAQTPETPKQKPWRIIGLTVLALLLLGTTSFFAYNYYQLKKLPPVSQPTTQQTPPPSPTTKTSPTIQEQEISITQLTELEGIPLCPLLKWEKPKYVEKNFLFVSYGEKKVVQISSATVELKNISHDYFLEERVPCELASSWYQKEMLNKDWERDNNFDADGPTGRMYGFSKGEKHLIIEENWGGIKPIDYHPSDYEKFNHSCSLTLIISL